MATYTVNLRHLPVDHEWFATPTENVQTESRNSHAEPPRNAYWLLHGLRSKDGVTKVTIAPSSTGKRKRSILTVHTGGRSFPKKLIPVVDELAKKYDVVAKPTHI